MFVSPIRVGNITSCKHRKAVWRAVAGGIIAFLSRSPLTGFVWRTDGHAQTPCYVHLLTIKKLLSPKFSVVFNSYSYWYTDLHSYTSMWINTPIREHAPSQQPTVFRNLLQSTKVLLKNFSSLSPLKTDEKYTKEEELAFDNFVWLKRNRSQRAISFESGWSHLYLTLERLNQA